MVKNTLAERAGAGTPNEPLLKNLAGTNSIAYTATDPVSLAKALTKIAKDVPAFQFRAGIVEGRVLSIAEIQQLASLPSKEELISKIMFLLKRRRSASRPRWPRSTAIWPSRSAKRSRPTSSDRVPPPVETAQ